MKKAKSDELRPEYEFKKIYDEYYPRIIQYLSRMVGPIDAEDMAQDVFDKINNGLGGFHGKSKLSTWIFRIATNTVIDRSRSAAYKQKKENIAIEDGAEHQATRASVSDKSPVTDQLVIRKEMSDCVNEFIDNLPPDYKTVIVLSEVEGVSNKEIAEILGISVDNVKIRLHRARARLRAALKEGCDFYYNDQNTLACDRKQVQILPKPPK